MTRTPASGTSNGPISRLRTRRLVAGSPVARSDQASTIHSTSDGEQHEEPDDEQDVGDDEAEHDEAGAEGADDRPVGRVGGGRRAGRSVGAGQLGERATGSASRVARETRPRKTPAAPIDTSSV